MNVNTETIRFLQSLDNRLCNDFIFNTITFKLEQIDFVELNHLHSQWSEVNEQTQIHKEYKIVIESRTSKQISLTFLLWNSFVNIYIGEEKIQIADDAQVKTEEESQKFSKILDFLFNCDIIETLFYKKDNLVGYDYIFKNNNSIVYRIKHNKLLKLFYNRKKTTHYASWIKIQHL